MAIDENAGPNQLEFWLVLIKIILINILLSSDNAIVMALAARHLPKYQQNKAIIFSSAFAIILRIILIYCAEILLGYYFLQLVGGGLLFYIALQLFDSEEEEEEELDLNRSASLWFVIYTMLLADLVMSFDNVIAIAAVANGSILTLVIALCTSIPIVMFSSTLIIHIIDQYPVIIFMGAIFIGFVAGKMMVSDAIFNGLITDHPWAYYTSGCLGALFVYVAARFKRARQLHNSCVKNPKNNGHISHELVYITHGNDEDSEFIREEESSM